MPLAAALAASAAAAAPGASVRVAPYGSVRGNLLERAREFLGIPYAAAPRRFEPPEPWTAEYPGGTLDATAYTPQCMQLVVTQFGPPPPQGLSEDCLHLNVYTPRAATAGAKLPVMLWIHGGGLTTGSAMNGYNASALVAEQNVVVVATNYRLNLFGFAPVQGADGGTVANNGFKDQQEAMRWVRKHIGAFGGDAASVTIFGESAGGQSTTTHVLSVSSAGLFDRAISESGDNTNVVGMDVALNQTTAWAAAVGCSGPSDLTCLRGLTAEKMLSPCPGAGDTASDPLACGSGAVVDGVVYSAKPLDLVRKGSFNRVPFIMGNNAEEGNLFVMPPLLPSRPATAAEVKCTFQAAFGDAAGQLLDVYAPVDAPGIDNRAVISAAFSDTLFHCADRAIAGELTAAGAAPWVYSWRHQPAPACVPAMPVPGPAHGTELAYVFALYGWTHCNTGVANMTHDPIPAPDLALAKRVSSLWAGFARSGEPEAGWPRYTLPAGPVLKLGLSTVTALDTETGYRRAECDAQLAAGVDVAHRGPASYTALSSGLVQCQRAAGR